jgi:hypothetical protein
MAEPSNAHRSTVGLNLVLLAGIGLVGYGLMFWYRNYHGFIELGLTPAMIGGTEEQIQGYRSRKQRMVPRSRIPASP